MTILLFILSIYEDLRRIFSYEWVLAKIHHRMIVSLVLVNRYDLSGANWSSCRSGLLVCLTGRTSISHMLLYIRVCIDNLALLSYAFNNAHRGI